LRKLLNGQKRWWYFSQSGIMNKKLLKIIWNATWRLICLFFDVILVCLFILALIFVLLSDILGRWLADNRLNLQPICRTTMMSSISTYFCSICYFILEFFLDLVRQCCQAIIRFCKIQNLNRFELIWFWFVPKEVCFKFKMAKISAQHLRMLQK
jgi:hypothetical protein